MSNNKKMNRKDIKFVRINGRIVPIKKSNKNKIKKPQRKDSEKVWKKNYCQFSSYI